MLSLFWADRPQVSVQTLDIKITYLISDYGNNNRMQGFLTDLQIAYFVFQPYSQKYCV